MYYYRANYFVWFVVCFIVSFFRNPLAFAAVALLGFTSLLWNDSFAHSVRRERSFAGFIIARMRSHAH